MTANDNTPPLSAQLAHAIRHCATRTELDSEIAKFKKEHKGTILKLDPAEREALSGIAEAKLEEIKAAEKRPARTPPKGSKP